MERHSVQCFMDPMDAVRQEIVICVKSAWSGGSVGRVGLEVGGGGWGWVEVGGGG